MPKHGLAIFGQTYWGEARKQAVFSGPARCGGFFLALNLVANSIGSRAKEAIACGLHQITLTPDDIYR